MTIRILPHTESDLPIPPIAAIRARCEELANDAWHQHDTERYKQLVNLIDALKRGIKMTWNLGDLLVSSASTPGVIYVVSCGHCTCPAWKPCKHLALAEVLLEMLDTLAGDCDFEDDEDGWDGGIGADGGIGYDAACDPPNEPPPLGPDEGDELPSRRPLGQRLAVARQCYISL